MNLLIIFFNVTQTNLLFIRLIDLIPSQITLILKARFMSDRESYCVQVKALEASISCSLRVPSTSPSM